MTLFDTIRVCTDFSPGALAEVERAAQLAVEHGAALRLLQSFDASPSLSSGATAPAGAMTPPSEHSTNDMRTSQLRQRLADSASQLAQRMGLTVESVLGIGTAFAVTASTSSRRCHRCWSSARASTRPQRASGGTVLKLLRSPKWPVLVVRSPDATPYRQVLSAVELRDGSVRAEVAALALFPRAHHHLLYAMAPALDSSLEAGGLGAEQVQSLYETVHAHAERELLVLAQGLSTKAMHPVAAEVANDVPARALLVGAASLQADCVVVGHHDATTAGQTELGSMALNALQFVPGMCWLFLERPRGPRQSGR